MNRTRVVKAQSNACINSFTLYSMQAGKVIPGVPVEASPKGQLTKQEDCVPKGTIMTEELN